MLRLKAEPLLAAWKQRILGERLLEPRARYGYFPVQAEGDALAVYAPDRDPGPGPDPLPAPGPGPAPVHRRLLRAGGRRPVRRAAACSWSPWAAGPRSWPGSSTAADRYADYFLFHGLATELTEAYAERLHAAIRRELGIHGKDARQLRQLFNQGYQGSRYSFGYPACPDLEGNAALLDLLDGAAIGVEITDQFQMDPEYTTSALVAWHPQARYFAV